MVVDRLTRVVPENRRCCISRHTHIGDRVKHPEELWGGTESQTTVYTMLRTAIGLVCNP